MPSPGGVREADELVHEALGEVGLDGSAPLVVHAKMLRLELINTKSALERELGRLALDCRRAVGRSAG